MALKNEKNASVLRVNEGYTFVFMIVKFLFYMFKEFVCVSKNVKITITKKLTYLCILSTNNRAKQRKEASPLNN